MALNELLHNLPEVVPLIPGTGVQFLDFGFSIVKNDGRPTEWGFHDPHTALNNDRQPRLARRGDQDVPRDVIESYAVDLKALEQMFDRVWMPLPLLRRESHGFYRGPTNWARGYLARLDAPDEEGHAYRFVLAADTTLLEFVENEAYLGPCAGDARTGRSFALPGPKDNIDWFYAEDWVKDWCLEAFKDMLEREERKRRKFSVRALTDDEVHEQMQGSNEHVARYRAYIDLLHALDILPAFKLEDRITEPRTPPIDVDLVLDLGNSRSCGLLIESDPDHLGVDITKSVKLELRDLSRAEQVYSDPFPSRFEFSRARFGRDHLSLRSGRSEAFSWPTVVRVGNEAQRLAATRSGTEGASGLSSPKRYLWDSEPRRDSWRFNQTGSDNTRGIGQSDFAHGVMFTTLVNDLGEPLHRISDEALSINPDLGFPAIRALYSRSNLTAFALAEIFVQAISMMNSPMHRLRRPANANLPRRLRRVIMTMPTAMPLAERAILKEQAQAACDMAYLSLGLAEVHYEDDGRKRLRYTLEGRTRADNDALGPEVYLQWDEATATQAVYLYTEVARNYSGDAKAFFDNMRHPLNQAEVADKQAGSTLGQSLRVATLDIGGGTTDLMVTSIAVDGSGANVTLTPFQEFREGFNLAGDDALLRVVRNHVIEPIKHRLLELGCGELADYALQQLFGGDRGDMKAVEYVRRQQFAAQIAAPIALGLLEDYEGHDPLREVGNGARPFADFFTADAQPTETLVSHVNAEIGKLARCEFRLQDMVFPVAPADIHRTVRSVFEVMLEALGEVVQHLRCDLLILSGRTSRLPAVKAVLDESCALPTHRIVPLHQYRVGPWYPFHDHRYTVGDPKTTAAVGAMICLLGNGQLQNFNFRSDQLHPRSTARFFGKIDQNDHLPRQDEFFDNLDLDNPDYDVPDKPFEFRGPIPLGFRQLAVERWPATRLYTLDYAAPDHARELSAQTPLAVTLKRLKTQRQDIGKDGETGRGFDLNPTLDIDRIANRDGGTVPKRKLRMRLQTLNNAQGYWLDTGILLGN